MNVMRVLTWLQHDLEIEGHVILVSTEANVSTGEMVTTAKLDGKIFNDIPVRKTTKAGIAIKNHAEAIGTVVIHVTEIVKNGK